MTEVIDKEKFIENLSDDPDIVSELLGMFELESKNILIELDKAMKDKNTDNMYKAVHSLKGSCSNLMVYDNVISDFQVWQLKAKEGKLTFENILAIKNIIKKVINDLQYF
jgi:hypothetical protein